MRTHAAAGIWLLLALLTSTPLQAAEDKPSQQAQRPKKIVLVAGTKSHGPGHHEYEQGARLLKACLDSSPNVPPLVTEVHTDGWPKDPATFDDADTIFFFCDGSDHDERDHPLLRPERLATIERQMKARLRPGRAALHDLCAERKRRETVSRLDRGIFRLPKRARRAGLVLEDCHAQNPTPPRHARTSNLSRPGALRFAGRILLQPAPCAGR